MSETMLVNVVNEEESRIAIISGNRLKELSVETAAHEQIEGNIYKAKIVKILPSLDAVFVDYGSTKNGFLAFPDIHPKYFSEGSRGGEGLRRGQELLVQVRKGEIGQKGAALTTYVSIPGRYIVLMPLVNKKGVSRKIQDEEARRELKDLLKDSGLPDDMGYIVRTAGHEQTKLDLSRDVGYLLRLWRKIHSTAEKAKAPCLLYQESDIVIRTIRDYFTPSIQEVWVDNPETCEQVRAFFRTVMPWYQKRVQLFEEKVPLFAKFDVEAQMASIYEKAVPLPAGGSLVIEQTEALVSVDVNSGKTMKGKDIEETAFIANCEAAEEVARQLRLRDLGGLIVIDFIDMRSSSRRNEVRKVLQKALKADKARIDVGTISKFGLLELSRQRIKPAGLTAAGVCPTCAGTGKVRSTESFALSMLRLLQASLARRTQAAPSQVLVGLPAEAAAILLNRKRRALSELEVDFRTSLAVFSEPALQANQYYIEYRRNGASKVETNLPDDFSRGLLKAPSGLPLSAVRAQRPSAYALAAEFEEEPIPEVPEEPADEVAGEGGPEGQSAVTEAEEKSGKKRKRRRRKKKKGAAGELTTVPDEDASEPPDQTDGPVPPGPRAEAAEEPAPLPTPATAEDTDAGKKLSPSAKRRLRRRRKKAQPEGAPAIPSIPGPGETAVTSASVEEAAVERAPAGEVPAASAPAPEPVAGKPKRPRRRSSSAKRSEPKEPREGESEAVQLPAAEARAPRTAPTPRTRRPAAGSAQPGGSPQPSPVPEPPAGTEGIAEAGAGGPKKAPRRRSAPSRKKKGEPGGEPPPA
ncbi:MAG: Rne/Rng family ribonuclease [Deltaproteobacteria bacterium]|nr:Rne/Rng family ribonuclease [Deltaproteobacteria bacterium]